MPDVIIYFEIIFAGSSSSVLTVTTMLEAAAKSWSSQVKGGNRLGMESVRNGTCF